jgi:PAS domain S-box-containing protein
MESNKSLNIQKKYQLDELAFYKKQEEIYHSLIDSLNIGLITIKDNIIVAANQKIISLLGYIKIDFLGLKVQTICPLKQSDGKLSSHVLNLAFRSATHTIVEINQYYFLHKNGRPINCTLRVSSSMVEDELYIQLEIHEILSKKDTAQKLREKNLQIESLSEEKESLNEELRATLDELVEVNKQLAESEIWNKSIVENIPLGLQVIKGNKTEHINDKFIEIAGFSYEELMNMEHFELAVPESQEKIKNFLEDFKKGTHTNSTLEYWIKNGAGDKKYIRNQYVKLNDTSRWMVISTDLTDDKNKETELIISHERLEFAIDANESVIWDVDLTAKENIFGNNFGKLFGYSAGELKVDKNLWRDLLHPDDFPLVNEELQRHSTGQTNYYETECRILTKSGDYKWVLARGKVFNLDAEGKPTRFIGMFVDISRRKQAEEKLIFSEEKFRTIVQHLSDIILIIDKNMIVQYESPSVSRTFGFESGHFIGQNGLNWLHPEDVNIAKKELAEVILKLNDYKPTNLRVKHRKGYWVHLEVLGDNLISHPAIGGILITARDISEQKESDTQLSLYRNHLEQLVKKRTEEIELMNAELIAINEELKATNEELAFKNDKLNEEIIKRIEAQTLLEESENKFRSFIEQSTEGIVLINEKGQIVDWNKGMESIFRIGREEIIDTYVWEFDYRFLPEKRKSAIQFEELKNATINYFSNLDYSKVMTVEGIYQNIELKQKYLSVTIFPVIASKHRYLGRIVRDITGIKRAQEEIEKQSEELRQINENLEEQKHQLEQALVELRKTQSQLIHSEKMASLGVLTAGVAHEINNPVNYINTALEGLKITLSDFLEIFYQYEKINIENVNDKLKEIGTLKEHLEYPLLQKGINILLGNMQTGIERITEIVKSLRTFARVEENELKFSNIHELIDTTLVMLHNQYKNRIEITKKYGQVSSIYCYPGKLSQVFMNLLSNALQAIPDKGSLLIKTNTEKEGTEFVISIKDDGIGIPEHVKDKIFEPFFTTKEAGKGTGLGLSITYGIVQQHNGNINVRSAPGEGTEFIIKIPTNLK